MKWNYQTSEKIQKSSRLYEYKILKIEKFKGYLNGLITYPLIWIEFKIV